MRAKMRSVGAIPWVCAAIAILACAPLEASGAELKLQSELVWGTDDSKPPEGKDYKPVESEIRNKLKELPLKWKNYFEVRRTNFSVSPGALKKVQLSEKCELNVLN